MQVSAVTATDHRIGTSISELIVPTDAPEKHNVT